MLMIVGTSKYSAKWGHTTVRGEIEMCRTGGRRCPSCSNQNGRAQHNARRRQNRAIKAAVLKLAASIPGAPVDQLRSGPPKLAKDWAQQQRLSDAAIQAAIPTKHPGPPTTTPHTEPPLPTRAGEFTAAKTALWSDAQLEQALSGVWHDQQAVDAIAALIDSRQDADQAVDDALAGRMEEARLQVWSTEPGWATRDPLVDPGRRESSKLTSDQQLRADYETYVDTQWLQAESDCHGQLLTMEARNLGVDARSLFSGSTTRAVKYASEELQSWWQGRGRLTLAAFRHQAFGRASDRAAAEQARMGHFDNAAAS